MVSRLDRMCRRPRCKPSCFEISILFYFVPRVLPCIISTGSSIARIPARSFGLDQVCVKPETAIFDLDAIDECRTVCGNMGSQELMELEGKRLGITDGSI